jgi:putative hydrolase of the HAD superfamily
MTPAAICFDATGTLIETAEPVGEVYHRIALDFGVDLPAWRLQDAFGRILRHAPTRGLEGETPDARRQTETRWWHERIRQTFQATDSTARFEDFDAFAMALFDHYRSSQAWVVRDGIFEMLRELRRRGLPLGIVSNFDHRLINILQDIELSGFFSCILTPSSCGAAKPDPRIFAGSRFRISSRPPLPSARSRARDPDALQKHPFDANRLETRGSEQRGANS